MNLSHIIYPRLMNEKNQGNPLGEINTIFCIMPELLQHENWLHYSTFDYATYDGILDAFVEMQTITDLAYTYFYNRQETLEISPFYMESLYKYVDVKKDLPASLNRRTINVLRTSSMLKDYIEIDSVGGMTFSSDTNKIEKKFTSYRMTENLKMLSLRFADPSYSLVQIDLRHVMERHSKIERIKTDLYECDGRKFDNFYTVRSYGKKNNKTWTRKTYVEQVLIHRCGGFTEIPFREFDKEAERKPQTVNLKRPVSFSHSVKIDRKELKKILASPDVAKKYSKTIYNELIRILHSTSDDNTEYMLYYYKTNEGRHYLQGSSFQYFPKELRNRLLSGYTELDMKSAIISLYRNLGLKYKYKGDMSEIEEFVRDSRAYRMQFVNDNLDYEDVKKVLTAISYGAKADVYNIGTQVLFNYSFHDSSLLHMDISDGAVLDLVISEKVQKLYKQLHDLGNFIIRKHKTKNDRSILRNHCGNELKISRGVSFGKKMAHIYQSYEALILETLLSLEVTPDKKLLRELRNTIGLLLHDGIYISRQIVDVLNLPECASSHIMKETGFSVGYECE